MCHLLSSTQPPGEHCPHADVQALGDEQRADRALGRPSLGLEAVFLQVPSGAKDAAHLFLCSGTSAWAAGRPAVAQAAESKPGNHSFLDPGSGGAGGLLWAESGKGP